MVNPVMMARCSRPVPSGPTIRDRLEREGRPSWDDVKKIVVKKEKASSDFLEKWENDQYREELTAIREAKRGDQERLHLKKLQRLRRKQSKTRKRSSSLSSDTDNSSDRASSADGDAHSAFRGASPRQHRGESKRHTSLKRSHTTDSSHTARESKHRHRDTSEDSRGSRSRYDRHRRRRDGTSKSNTESFNPHKFSSFLRMTSKL